MKKSNFQGLLNYLTKPWVLFVFFTILGAIIFFLRFPNNFTEPNFYAEDGSIFLTNIQHHGFINAVFTSFNGYFIIGLYLMEGFAYVINFVGQKEFIDLAGSFAIASYIFLGAVAALPFLLFKKHFNFFALLIVFLLVAFVPLPGSDYAVIGTIGNAKFAFVYIAFLLLVYRQLTPEKQWKRIIVADIFIALCAYTNIVVYPLLLFTIIRYIPNLRKKGFWSLFKVRSFQSLIGLGIVLIPQLIYIKINGIPAMPGYLDTPYQAISTVNLFIYRPYLFPFLDISVKSMHNTVVIAAFIMLLVMLWFGLKKRRSIALFAVISVFAITLLFVVNRTGVSSLFLTYASGGPDQFFYTQNMIVCFVTGIALFELTKRIKLTWTRRLVWIALGIWACAVYIPASGTFGQNDFMQKTVGNIYINAQKECSQSNAINIQLYPINSTSFQLKNQSRSEICTNEVINYIPSVDDLNLTNGSLYIDSVAKHSIQQTFIATYNHLRGIGIEFLTYKARVNGAYTLTLYDNTCKQVLQTVTIRGSDIQDARYARFSLKPIEKSANITYCYKIMASSDATSPLAVSLSKDNEYPQGVLSLDTKANEKDIMMELYYAR